ALVGGPHRRAAARRHHVDAAVSRPQAAGQAAAAGLAVDDAAAVGREPRVVVETLVVGQAGSLAGAVGVAHVDRAHRLVRPSGVEQLVAVGAEAGLVFVQTFVAGQALWFT